MRVLLFIGFICFGNSVLSQLKDPIVGPEYSTAKKENFSGFLGESAIGLYTADYVYYSRKKQELFIRQFHKGDLQLVDSKNIYSEIMDGYTNSPEEIFFQNNRIFLFSKLSSERDQSELLALEIFNERCERQELMVIDTLNNEEIEYLEESQSDDGFILAKHLKFTQLVEQQIQLAHINGEGQIDWEKQIKSPMALQNLRIEQIRFSKESPIYILCNYAFDLGSNASDRLVNNKYALWAYDHKKRFLKEFEIRLDAKWVNGIDMRINADHDLVLCGYFNETKNPAINGVFSMILNTDFKVKNSAWYKFDNGVFDKFLKKDGSTQKNRELEDYKMKDLVLMDDGSFYIAGEQFYKYIERSYDPRTNITTTTEHYNYNSIIVSRFDASGNHLWTERIPKPQNSTNDLGYFSSFATMNTGKDIYFFFNDSRKNNETEGIKDYFDYSNLFNNRRFQISYVKVDANGVATRGGLLDEKYDFMLRAKLSEQITKSSIYLMTETSRYSKIVRIELKN